MNFLPNVKGPFREKQELLDIVPVDDFPLTGKLHDTNQMTNLGENGDPAFEVTLRVIENTSSSDGTVEVENIYGNSRIRTIKAKDSIQGMFNKVKTGGSLSDSVLIGYV